MEKILFVEYRQEEKPTLVPPEANIGVTIFRMPIKYRENDIGKIIYGDWLIGTAPALSDMPVEFNIAYKLKPCAYVYSNFELDEIVKRGVHFMGKEGNFFVYGVPYLFRESIIKPRFETADGGLNCIAMETETDRQNPKVDLYTVFKEHTETVRFAEFLKDYARQVQENGYDGIGENDIDEKLKEFLTDDNA